MQSNTLQQLTKHGGKPMIDKNTKLPIFSAPVDYRIKRVKAELNKGLSKFDSIWHNITRDAAHLTV